MDRFPWPGRGGGGGREGRRGGGGREKGEKGQKKRGRRVGGEEEHDVIEEMKAWKRLSYRVGSRLILWQNIS